MGTRSMIGAVRPNGKVDVVYCHWDGYIEEPGVGWTLYTYWPTIQCARTLVAHGGMSSLGRELGQKHDFNDSNNDVTRNWCTFYRRDRGDKPDDEMICTYDTPAKMIQDHYAGAFNAAYAYLHTGHEWRVVAEDYTATPLRELLIDPPRIVARQRRRTHIPRAINWGD